MSGAREVPTVVLVRIAEALGAQFEIRSGVPWLTDSPDRALEGLDLWLPLLARSDEVLEIIRARQVVDELLEDTAETSLSQPAVERLLAEVGGGPQLQLPIPTPDDGDRRQK